MEKPEFYTEDQFNQLRKRQDPLADSAARILFEKPQLITKINQWKEIPDELGPEFPEELCAFFQFFIDQKERASPEVLSLGQSFFEKNGDMYLGLLGLYSLPYCYAFGNGAEVLVRSRRILESIGTRLGETSVFVLDVFRPGAFFRDDRAYLSCAKIRLIHAFSRIFVEKYAKDWNPLFGKPINQEDLLGTSLAFSFIVLRGMIKLGINLDATSYQAVLSYWGWISKLLGVAEDYWPDNAKEAIALDRLIRNRQLRQSEAGKKLIGALAAYYKTTIPELGIRNSVDFLLSFFLGKEVATVLGLPKPVAISGNLVDLFFKAAGKNLLPGSKPSYMRLKNQLERQQKKQFGHLLTLDIPVPNRP